MLLRARLGLHTTGPTAPATVLVPARLGLRYPPNSPAPKVRLPSPYRGRPERRAGPCLLLCPPLRDGMGERRAATLLGPGFPCVTGPPTLLPCRDITDIVSPLRLLYSGTSRGTLQRHLPRGNKDTHNIALCPVSAHPPRHPRPV